MKQLLLLFCFLILSCSDKDKEVMPTSDVILKKSIQMHDPNNEWSKMVLDIHVQEPRVGNPTRFSQVKLNNQTGEFELIRNRDKHFSTHQINANGIATTLLDGTVVKDSALIKKYRLDPNRNKSYRSYYQNLYGLPMALSNMVEATTVPVEKVSFNAQTCYKLTYQLKEKLFSNHWNVYFAKNDFKVIGIEIFFPEDETKGERIFFDGEITFGKVSIPRHRHWHEFNGSAYSGSDIIVKSNHQ